MKWTTRRAVLGMMFVALLAGCGGAMADSPDEIVNGIVGRQNKIYVENQPVPIYDYSAQRDTVIQLYNATVPKSQNTWTVFYEMGTATDSCASKGYPIPYGVSLTSPEYMKDGGGSQGDGSVTLPQPEPSGLYTNTVTSAASWVLCLNPSSGAVEPVYAEGNVRTYSHPVTVKDNEIVHDYTQSTIQITVKGD